MNPKRERRKGGARPIQTEIAGNTGKEADLIRKGSRGRRRFECGKRGTRKAIWGEGSRGLYSSEGGPGKKTGFNWPQ